MARAILQPAPAQFAEHSVSTSPHILSPASRKRLNTLASTSPTPAIKRRSLSRPFPAGLLLVMMPQTSLTIAVWQRAAKLLMSDKEAVEESARGRCEVVSDVLEVNALACVGVTSSFTFPKSRSYQMPALMAATNNAAPTLANTNLICTFKPGGFDSSLFNPQGQ